LTDANAIETEMSSNDKQNLHAYMRHAFDQHDERPASWWCQIQDGDDKPGTQTCTCR